MKPVAGRPEGTWAGAPVMVIGMTTGPLALVCSVYITRERPREGQHNGSLSA